MIEESDLNDSRFKILDATCGSRSIWFNKHHPNVLYCDKRNEVIKGCWTSEKTKSGFHNKTWIVRPDVVCDFTNLPFEDDFFNLVVFDPPHIVKASETAWIVKAYGKLEESWREMLHDGFTECMRVLRPYGTLVFKWNEVHIPADEVWKAICKKPLFGHHSGKKSNTFWGCFMKGVE